MYGRLGYGHNYLPHHMRTGENEALVVNSYKSASALLTRRLNDHNCALPWEVNV